jgi:polysaccharide export outer membrane protein
VRIYKGYIVSTVKFSALVVGTALVLHGVCSAQTTRLGAGLVDAPMAQPLDFRVGSLRPMDSPDPLTDGGIRTAPSPSPSMQNLTMPMVTRGKDYHVNPNDLIEVEIFEMENLRRTVRVNADGAISLPLIGQVRVGGLTSQEIEARITERYSERYLQNPQVSVFIKEFTPDRITIEGAVGHPGIFPMTGRLTLLRALAMAGGFGSIANTSQVMVYRANDHQERQSAVYDIEKIRAGKAEDPPIQGDDLIVVQRDSTRVLLKDSLLRDVIDSVNPFSILVPR